MIIIIIIIIIITITIVVDIDIIIIVVVVILNVTRIILTTPYTMHYNTDSNILYTMLCQHNYYEYFV